MSLHTQLVIDISVDESPNLSARSRKYVTCLQLAHQILSKEISSDIPLPLFNQLGIVSGFIDQHLDELSVAQQKVLLENYDSLFNSLWSTNHYLIFTREICGFVDSHNFQFQCEALYIKDLFLFLKHCKSLNIENKTREFGKKIIAIAINKQQAISSNEMISLLSQEGNAVIDLLRNLLTSKFGNNAEFKNTLRLLMELEHILNVADDTLDVSSDKIRGLINRKMQPFHQLRMAHHLMTQVVKTIVKYPRKTAYYAPQLTWYYFKNTL